MANKNTAVPDINTAHSVNNRVSESDMDEMVGRAAKELKDFPVEEIRLPLLDRKNDTVEVCYNGYNVVIKRGVNVKLPMPIMRILRHSGLL